MKINCVSVGQNPSYRGLNYSKVIGRDRGYVMDELEQLEKLAKDYNIALKTDIATSTYPYRTIRVTVSPLKSTLNFFRKIFPPKVSMHFYTDIAPYPEADNEYLTDVVKNAIKYLNS